jgi:hypothetical protein
MLSSLPIIKMKQVRLLADAIRSASDLQGGRRPARRMMPAIREETMNSLRSGRPFVAAAALWMLAAAFLAPPVRADERSVRKEIEALYARYARLVKQDERYPLKRFFLEHTTDDFRMKSENGKIMSREDAAANIDEGPMAMARFTGQDYRIVKLAVKGNQAVVDYRDRTTAVIEDREGNPHKLVSTSTARDTWVKTPEGWKTRLTEVFSSKTLLDGKEVKPRRTKPRRS